MSACTPPSETSPIRCSVVPAWAAASNASTSTGFSKNDPSSIALVMRVRSW